MYIAHVRAIGITPQIGGAVSQPDVHFVTLELLGGIDCAEPICTCNAEILLGPEFMTVRAIDHRHKFVALVTVALRAGRPAEA